MAREEEQRVIRKNYKSLEKEQKENFIKAVLKLKANGEYDTYVIWHAKAMRHMLKRGEEQTRRNAAHYSPVFLPWHRQFLYEFERDLQDAVQDESLAVPYWDWTEDASDPKNSPIWNNEFMGGDGDPNDIDAVKTGHFAYDNSNPNSWTTVEFDDKGNPISLPPEQRRLERAFGRYEPNIPTRENVEYAKKQVPYDSSPWDNNTQPTKSFRRALEMPPHNNVHRWVGGHMITGGSPNDPVFFLHHCYIDRIWAKWQAEHEKELEEDQEYPNDGSITYPKEENTKIDGQNRKAPMYSKNEKFDGPTVETVLDHRKLEYIYDFELSTSRTSKPQKKRIKNKEKERIR